MTNRPRSLSLVLLLSRPPLVPMLAVSAAMAACNGWTTVLESSSSSSSSSSSGAGGSPSSSSSSSSSGSTSSSSSGSEGGASTSSGTTTGAGGASSSSSSSGSGGQGGTPPDAGIPGVYATDFEGPCPNGWTLSGDWECGAPSGPGPAAAFSGTQCIATRIAANYSPNDTFGTTTATSPTIDLTAAPAPKLTFRMWLDTEGGSFDGARLEVSTDGGASFGVVSTVVPAYPLTIVGKPAWGGHQAALGWQLVSADLSAYAGQLIKLRFAFRSDGASNFPGVYIDDVTVTDD